MDYKLVKDKIIIYNKEDFCPKHILECGQIFSYKEIVKNESGCDKDKNTKINKCKNTNDLNKRFDQNKKEYVVYSADKMATIKNRNGGYVIETKDVAYFENFFDLKTDYGKIKSSLIASFPHLSGAITFGHGIRLLNQDIFETIISFIVSANNNIKRIQKILFAIREKFGENMGDYYSFPNLSQLKKATVQDFKNMGAGYRAEYLYKAIRQLEGEDLEGYKALTTKELNNKLLSLMGVGQKVADCIMLFAFSRRDVFPVDTWIEKVYNTYFEKETNRVKIRQNLLLTFGELAGFSQQYLFYSQRSSINN